MICEFCDGNTHTETVRRQHWLDGKLYIIENVTAEVCAECGDRYFHATVLDQIDRLLRANHPVKQTLEVEDELITQTIDCGCDRINSPPMP